MVSTARTVLTPAIKVFGEFACIAWARLSAFWPNCSYVNFSVVLALISVLIAKPDPTNYTLGSYKALSSTTVITTYVFFVYDVIIAILLLVRFILDRKTNKNALLPVVPVLAAAAFYALAKEGWVISIALCRRHVFPVELWVFITGVCAPV